MSTFKPICVTLMSRKGVREVIVRPVMVVANITDACNRVSSSQTAAAGDCSVRRRLPKLEWPSMNDFIFASKSVHKIVFFFVKQTANEHEIFLSILSAKCKEKERRGSLTMTSWFRMRRNKAKWSIEWIIGATPFEWNLIPRVTSSTDARRIVLWDSRAEQKTDSQRTRSFCHRRILIFTLRFIFDWH